MTRLVAQINSRSDKAQILASSSKKAIYDTALSALTTLDSTQSEVDSALAALQNLLPTNSGVAIAADSAILTPQATLVGSLATLTVTQGELQKAMLAAAAQNTKTVTVSPIIDSAALQVTLILTAEGVSSLALGGTSLLLQTPFGTVTIAAEVFAGLPSDEVQLSFAKTESLDDELIRTISVTAGGKPVTNFGGTLTVTIPLTELAADTQYTALDALGAPLAAQLDTTAKTLTIPLTKAGQVRITAVKKAALLFSDVPDTHWAYTYIATLTEKGIIKGMTETVFAPEQKVTRAQFLTLLMRMSGEKSVVYQGTFSDVSSDDWFSGAVAWGIKAGVTKGISQTTFAPDAEITREDMAVMLLRFTSYMKYSLPTYDAAAFTDRDTISQYATESVRILQQAGLLSGKGENKFLPQDFATRAEACKLIAMLDQMGITPKKAAA